MIATVSTVKDTLANVQRFVRGNLAGGVDHMVVFLDGPDAEVEAWLADQEHVTCLVADDAWWGGKRPADLNDRQRLHANITKAVLTVVPGVDWLFHVDADEICQIDRAAIASVPASYDAVRLAPLEAVSRKHWDASPTWFKRLLGESDLKAAGGAGGDREAGERAVLPRPRGGQDGDPAPAGPVADHPPHGGREARRGAALQGARAQRAALRVLLRRGLRAEVERDARGRPGDQPAPGAGADQGRGAGADRQAAGRGACASATCSASSRRRPRTTSTPCVSLGLLVEADPTRGTHTPEPFAGKDDLAAALAALADQPKDVFGVCKPVGPAQEVLSRLGAGDGKKSWWRKNGRS
ncbi:hypothetical protein G5V59_08920 [Nocardioides sp. W3-2-3]|uniref:glycosyltransferase family 2 protein n=1 Tax=Nocardioides convexus TaxID=2712224 RepID=UPI00241834D6|nr:glycosyltransferase family 2 protein [Nocardioides convexus]NHA00208.1 hypothetical protein [Nocardioides convexus]